jgi:hypothetical protein
MSLSFTTSAGFEILMAVTRKIFCDAISCSLAEAYGPFGGTYYYHLHGQKVIQITARRKHSSLWLGLLFDPDDKKTRSREMSVNFTEIVRRHIAEGTTPCIP